MANPDIPAPIVPAPRRPALLPTGPRPVERETAPRPTRPVAAGPQLGARRRLEVASDSLLWVLGCVVAMYVWRFQGLFPIVATAKITLLSMCLALLIFANDHAPERSLSRLDSPTFRAVLGILLMILISTPFSVYKRVSFEFLTTDFLLNLAMMVLVAASVRRPKDVDWHIRAFMFGCALYTLISIKVSRSDRLAGKNYYDANDFGTLLVCSLPLAVYLVQITRSKIWRILGVGLVMLILYAIVKTQSRGAFLGLLAAGAFILVAFRTIPARVRIGVAIAGTVLFATVATQEFWDRMGTLMKPEEDYNYSGQSVSGRMEVWKRGMGYMLHNPVGVGPFAFPHAEGRSEVAIARLEEGKGFKWSAAHNSFVEIGAELGVVGLTLMLVAIGGCLRGLRRLSKLRREDPELAGSAQAVQGAIIGFCVAGFFVSFAYSSLLYWLFGIAIGILKLGPDAPWLKKAQGTSPAR